MARTDAFAALSEFMAVVEGGTFRAAAAKLRVTPAAVSQAIKSLETRIGAPLFLRTTRSVALTEAGSRLYQRMQPATTEIMSALREIHDRRGHPTGTLRLSVPRIALDLVVMPLLPAFHRQYPNVKLDLDVNDASIDIAGSGFDAGIRLGHTIEKDMIAVRLTAEFRWCVVGSPDYLRRRGEPKSPEELEAQDCIAYRFPTAGDIARWHFRRRGRSFSVGVSDVLVVNDHLTMVSLAQAGAGLAYTADPVAANALKAGRLRKVLEPYCPSTPGLFLYFPRRSQTQPKLRAFIDLAKAKLSQ